MRSVISVRSAGKKYTLHHQLSGAPTTLRAALAQSAATIRNRLRDPTGADAPSREEFWALRDVNIEVQAGERIGIIGRNGAGKSTLLKLLCRITEPSCGEIRLQGRVSGLLEVGAGFHPELTGRENIFLNGAILGMSRNEIRAKFDEIVEFADVARFLDTPVKRYSSGMYVRLAFSVAASLEPEILIVDEVLAVGDFAFQKKCLKKMDDVATSGRTVVLVSHNMLSIQDLCTRALWLHDGTVRQTGTVGEVISSYLQTYVSNMTDRVWRNRSDAPGNEEVRLTQARVKPHAAAASGPIHIVDAFDIEFVLYNATEGAYLSVSLQVYNEHGMLLFESAPVHQTDWLGQPHPRGEFKYCCQVPGNLLNDGIHRVTLVISKNQGQVLHREEDVLVFEVIDSTHKRAGWYGKWEGAIRPILDWETALIVREEQ